MMPVTNGTIFFCFLPYRKNPRPIEPKSIPQRSSEVSSIIKFSKSLCCSARAVAVVNQKNFTSSCFEAIFCTCNFELFFLNRTRVHPGKSFKQHLPDGLLVAHEHKCFFVCSSTKRLASAVLLDCCRVTPKQ